MLGLPNFGDLVKIWPWPGKKVQDGPIPAGAPVNWMPVFLPKSGKVVVWSPFHHEQMLHGELLLHPPPCDGCEHTDEADDCVLCAHCGRTQEESAQYHADFAKGAPAAAVADKAARVAARKAPPAPAKPALFDPLKAQARDIPQALLDAAKKAGEAFDAKRAQSPDPARSPAPPPDPPKQ